MSLDKQTADNMVLIMITIVLVISITDIYYYFIKYWIDSGVYNKFSLTLIGKAHNIGYLGNNYISKLVVSVPLFFAIIGNTPRKKKGVDIRSSIFTTVFGALLFFLITPLIYYHLDVSSSVKVPFYILSYVIGIFSLLNGLTQLFRVLKMGNMDDRFNVENESFQQCEELITNDLSVNIPSKFYYKKKWRKGWVNIVAPNRSTMILGKPGSGKSYAWVEEFIKQHIQKGFAFVNYDYKFPTLTNVAYSYLQKYQEAYKQFGKVRFAIINIDDPKYSDRCNPIHPKLLKKDSDIIDAVYTIFYNIDKNSITKEDFFKMSAAAITSASLLFLKLYEDGKYCSLPHLIEFLNQPYQKVLKILGSYQELRYFTGSFSDALENEAYEQLSGQVASAKIPLSKLVTKEMFYVMTDPENTGIDLRVNDPDNLTILNIANNPETQKSNAPANGLYMSQISKLINKQNRVPCEFLVDELPTIYINGLDNLIATGRSNKICVTLSFQDLAQLERDYGKEIANAIFNTVTNIISGNVVNETARKISDNIGKVLQERESTTINKEGDSTSISTQLDLLIPPSKISQLSTGEFVGVLGDTFKEPLPTKVFHAKISPDKSDLKLNEVPIINERVTEQELINNQKRIQQEIIELIEEELERIDP